jgi:hypothetical protein
VIARSGIHGKLEYAFKTVSGGLFLFGVVLCCSAVTDRDASQPDPDLGKARALVLNAAQEALALAENEETPVARDVRVARVAVHISEIDPDFAIPLVDNVGRRMSQVDAFRGIARRIADDDPDRAVTLLVSAATVAAKLSVPFRVPHLEGVLIDLIDLDLKKATEINEELMPEPFKSEFRHRLYWESSRSLDPRNIAWFTDFVALLLGISPRAIDNPYLHLATAEKKVKSDPQTALAALRKALALARQEPPFHRARLLLRIADTMTELDPADSAAILKEASPIGDRLDRPEDRAEMLVQIARITARISKNTPAILRAFLRALSVIKELSPSSFRDWLLYEYAFAVLPYDLQGALDVAREPRSTGSGPIVERYVLLDSAVEDDPDTVLAILDRFSETSDDKSFLMERAVNALAERDPVRALEIAQTIPDEWTRHTEIARIAGFLAEQDPEAAERALEGLDDWQTDTGRSLIAVAVAPKDPEKAGALIAKIQTNGLQKKAYRDAALASLCDRDRVDISRLKIALTMGRKATSATALAKVAAIAWRRFNALPCVEWEPADPYADSGMGNDPDL